MKKIFLTGGNSLIGKKVIATSPCEIFAPGREHLDLHDSQAIKGIDFTGFDTLMILHRAGSGERYYFKDWPEDNLEYNLHVNVTNTMLLIHKWLRQTDGGTVFYMGTSDVNDRCDYKIPYWGAKEMITNCLHSLKKTYKNLKVHTMHPASFEAKTKPFQQNIRSADEITNLIWKMINDNLSHLDVFNDHL
jgi:short-subunit dehydrogenase